MAVITISRQVAALGDEIANSAAEKLGYSFVDRMQIEQRLVDLGFPKEKLSKYDERKPGFFANLVKDRDEYLNYLQYAVLEAASKGNCILIGRGANKILEGMPNVISLRFVAENKVRLERLKHEKHWNDKQAQQRIDESDANRRGFHKSFFNMTEDAENFLLTMNTGILSLEDSVKIIDNLVSTYVTDSMETEGRKMMDTCFRCQDLVNKLLYEFKMNISFLHAVADPTNSNAIILHGITNSYDESEKAVKIAAKILPSREIRNGMNIVQDFESAH